MEDYPNGLKVYTLDTLGAVIWQNKKKKSNAFKPKAHKSKKGEKAKSKLPLKTIIIILAVLLLEGGTITLFMAFKGGPTPAEGTNPIEGDTQLDQKEYVEVTLAESFNVDNYMGVKTRLMITMEVCAKVAKEKNEE